VSPYLPVPDRVEYPARVLILAVTIWYFSRRLLTLRNSFFLLSFWVGVAVFAIWVAPDLLVPGWRSHWLFQNDITGSLKSSISEESLRDWFVLIVRSIRAIVIVPIVEELFWRGWLMRWLAGQDFQKVPLGTYEPRAFWITALLFAAEHGPYWEVGLLAGVVYNWLMVRTRSLTACILAHAVTNACLCLFVVATGRWEYWL